MSIEKKIFWPVGVLYLWHLPVGASGTMLKANACFHPTRDLLFLSDSFR